MLTAALSALAPRMRLKSCKPNIENIVFKLHYKLTVTLLVAFVILVCAREYFGGHIRCIADAGLPSSVIETYCFFMATFTVVRHYDEELLEAGALPHPGVGPISDSDQKITHNYYQWVPFILFIQSICFYIPHHIWKQKEGGRIKALVDGLQLSTLANGEKDVDINGKKVLSRETLEKKLEIIRKDIIQRLRITRTWCTWLVAMEVTNLVHVMLQVWIIDRFLKGQFMNLGWNVISFSEWNNITNPLDMIFPKVTKCIFNKYGPSGTLQLRDALCIMPLNVIHEKIYTGLWFWLFFLFIASLLAVIWRAISFYLYRRSLRFNEIIFHRVTSQKINQYNLITVINNCQFEDWLFLYYLAGNMSGHVFCELFARLAEELEKQQEKEYGFRTENRLRRRNAAA